METTQNEGLFLPETLIFLYILELKWWEQARKKEQQPQQRQPQKVRKARNKKTPQYVLIQKMKQIYLTFFDRLWKKKYPSENMYSLHVTNLYISSLFLAYIELLYFVHCLFSSINRIVADRRLFDRFTKKEKKYYSTFRIIDEHWAIGIGSNTCFHSIIQFGCLNWYE